MAPATTAQPDGMAPIRIVTTLTNGPNRRIIAAARGHRLTLDTRKEWGGEDAGPNPPECMIIGLGGCVLNIARIIAGERRLPVEDIAVTVAGDIDPSRAFGLETATRAGFTALSIEVAFTPKLSASDREDLHRELMERCPLCDTIGNPTPLHIKLSA